jgi:hypothetical protein
MMKYLYLTACLAVPLVLFGATVPAGAAEPTKAHCTTPRKAERVFKPAPFGQHGRSYMTRQRVLRG